MQYERIFWHNAAQLSLLTWRDAIVINKSLWANYDQEQGAHEDIIIKLGIVTEYCLTILNYVSIFT